MSAKECVVCAWRANCNLKFRYQSTELHCKEFTRDVSIETQKKKIEKSGETG